MRIISGIIGGQVIKPPTKMPHTRPTTQVAKEGLFNILQNYIEFDGINTLDLFGGTGAITYELFSRGAENLVVIEKDPKMNAFIKTQSEKFKIKNIQILLMDIFQYIQKTDKKFDFIFAGPPYSLSDINKIPSKIFQYQLVNPQGLFVLEHTPDYEFENEEFFRFKRNYGTTVFSFFYEKRTKTIEINE